MTLSVLIVVCCTAVFYLLRHHEPTDQDRVARRERYRRTREHDVHTVTLNSSVSTATLAGGFGSLGGKVQQWWQSSTGRGRGRGRGWIRAGSEDEWAVRSDHDGDPERGGDHARSESLGVLQPKRPITRDGDGEGDGVGVRVIESPSSDTASGFIHAPYGYGYGIGYTDPFSKTAGVHGALQRSHSPPLSSPGASSPGECASVDESHSSPGEDHRDRHRSTMSNSSVWTHAGSKFVEDI